MKATLENHGRLRYRHLVLYDKSTRCHRRFRGPLGWPLGWLYVTSELPAKPKAILPHWYVVPAKGYRS